MSNKEQSEIEGKTYFDVAGGGYIYLTNHAEYYCGNAEGFGIGVTWGRNGEAGGVIDKEDAIRLANHILLICNK